MPHKFDAHDHARLLSPERRRRQPVGPALELLGLEPGHVLIDVGCGPGYFLLPAARRVRRAVGLDVSPAMLAALRKGAKAAGLRNVRAVRMGEAKIPLAAASADRALLANVLHELESPGKVLAAIRRTLAPGGRLVVVDWKRRPTPHGPPMAERIGRETARRMLFAAGFRKVSARKAYGQFYALVAETD